MTKAVRVHKVGGPEALVYEAIEVPAPGPGEVRIRQHAVGLNFIDVTTAPVSTRRPDCRSSPAMRRPVKFWRSAPA